MLTLRPVGARRSGVGAGARFGVSLGVVLPLADEAPPLNTAFKPFVELVIDLRMLLLETRGNGGFSLFWLLLKLRNLFASSAGSHGNVVS